MPVRGVRMDRAGRRGAFQDRTVQTRGIVPVCRTGQRFTDLKAGGLGPGGGGAQPRHANYWAPRTRKRHQQEHRPQRPTERSDPTQHAKGRRGDCPGPRKGATTRRNVTQGGGDPSRPPTHNGGGQAADATAR